MRILMPNGTVMEIAKAIAVCEQRLFFNGRTMRLCEKATDIVFANGIAFLPETRAYDGCGMAPADSVMIGNLDNSFISAVLTSLVESAHINLSDLKLQKKQPLATQYVFDNGKSDAYMLSGFEVSLSCADALGYPFVNDQFPAVCEAEDEDEDAGEEDSDE